MDSTVVTFDISFVRQQFVRQQVECNLRLLVIVSMLLSSLAPLLDASRRADMRLPVRLNPLATWRLLPPSTLVSPIHYDIHSGTPITASTPVRSGDSIPTIALNSRSDSLPVAILTNAAADTITDTSVAMGEDLLPSWLRTAASDNDLTRAWLQVAPMVNAKEAASGAIFAAAGPGLCTPANQLTVTVAPPILVQENGPSELFTVVVSNLAAITATTDARLLIAPPPGYQFIGNSASAISNISGTLPVIQPVGNTVLGASFSLLVAGNAPTSSLQLGEVITFSFRLRASQPIAVTGQTISATLQSGESPTLSCQSAVPVAVASSSCPLNVSINTQLTIPPGTVSLGNFVGDVYTLTMTNNGIEPLTDLSFRLLPSTGFYFVGGSATVQGVGGSIPISQPLANTTPTSPLIIRTNLSLPGSTVLPGQTVTMTFRMATTGVAPSGQPLQVDVRSGNEPTQICDSEIRNIPTGRGNLAIIKSPEIQPAVVGDVVTWTVNVRNTGLGNIYSATVSDSVSAGISLLSISPSLSTLPATLPPNASQLFTVTGRINACTGLLNRAVGAWSIGNEDGTATSVITNPTSDIAAVAYDFLDPAISVQMQPVSVTFCGALDTTRIVTIASTGGSVRNFRLNASTSGGVTLSNLDTTNWTSAGGVYTYQPANNGIVQRNQVVTFTARVQAPNVCSPTIGEIVLAPIYRDPCTLAESVDPAAVVPVVSPSSPSLDLQKDASNLSANPGETVYYTLTVSGVNPAGVMPSIRITDAMPSGLTNIQYSTSLTPGLTNSGNLVDLNMPVPTGNYSIQVFVRGSVPTNVCGGGAFINVARASYPGCPLCNVSDADAEVLYLNNQIGFGTGNRFTMTSGAAELCGPTPGNKSAVLSITNGITWTGSLFEDDLDTGGGPGPLFASNVKVFVNGVDRTASVTVTTSTTTTPRLRVRLDGIGSFSSTASISITYNISASASATPGFGLYFSRFTLGGLPTNGCGTTGTALNSILLERAILGNLTVDPSLLSACRVNNIRIRVDGGALATTLSKNMVVSFTANAGDIYTPTQFVLGGGFITLPTSSVLVTKTGNIVTFTFPITFDLDSAGTIDFPLFRQCGEIRPLTGTLRYLDRCDLPGSASNSAGQQTQESNLLLLAPVITYTLNHTQTTWNFAVRNTGSISALNAIVTSTLPFGHNVLTYSLGNVPATIASAVTFVTGTVGSVQVLTWNVPVLDAGQRIQFNITNTVRACNQNGDQLHINLREPCGRVGGTCAGRQSAQIGFETGTTALLSSNTQDGILPMCEPGTVVLTVKNASPKSDQYRFAITDVIRSATYQFGSATLSLVDESGVTLFSALPFTPTQIVTFVTVPPTQTLTWAGDMITNSYPISVQNAMRRLGASSTLVIRFRVNTNCASTNVSVSSSVAALNVCGTPQRLQESAKSLILGAPDLKVSKAVRNATENGAFANSVKAAVGDSIVWQLTVKNDGKQRALNLFVQDILPSWFSVTSTSIPTSTQISNTGGITLNWHGAGGFVLSPTLASLYLITGTVAANACSNPAPNRAVAFYGCSASDICTPSFVTATADVDFKPVLSLTAPDVILNQCGPGPIAINFANTGSRAQHVVLSYTLPAGYAYAGLVTTTVPIPALQPTVGATGTVTWTFSAIERDWITNTLVFNVANTIGVCPTSAAGTADMRYQDTCGIPYDDVNGDENQLTIQRPTLVGSLSGSPQTPLTRVVTSGQVTSWTIGILNSGNGNAQNVLITETLAPGYTLVTATAPSGYTRTVSGNTITWTAPSMAPNAIFNAVVSATVPPAPNSLGLTLTAISRCANGGCLQLLPYRSYATAMQAFTKTNLITQATIGDLITFTINANLFGNYPYTSTILSDILPSGLGYVGSSLRVISDTEGGSGGPFFSVINTPSSAPAANATGTIRWDLGTLNGQILITGVITAVVRNVASNFDGVVLTNQALLTYRDDGQPYTFATTSTLSVLEPLLHINKQAISAQSCSATLHNEDLNGSGGAWNATTGWAFINGLYRNTGNLSNLRAINANFVGGSDYSFSFLMRTNDASGSMGGYLRQTGGGTLDTGYLFRWSDTGMTLEERNSGLVGTLASNAIGYQSNRWYHIEIRAQDSQIEVYVDGLLYLVGNDSSFPTGRVGLLASSLTQVDFDDVVVTKLNSASCLIGAGDLVTYTLNILNQGQVTGHNLVITDALPAGLTFVTYTVATNRPPVTVTVAPPVSATGTITWAISQLDPISPFVTNNHSAIALTVIARISPQIPAAFVLTNQASLAYDSQRGSGPATIQRDSSGGSHSVAVQSVPPPGLVKTVDPITATIGQTLIYTILVPSTPITAALNAITVTDRITANLLVTPTISVIGSNAITPQVANYLSSGALITVAFERIEASTQATIVITTIVTNSVPNQSGIRITNTATFNWSNGFGNPQPPLQSNMVTTTLTEPMLTISKTALTTSGVIRAGDMITYTLRVSHAPSSTASAYDVLITDVIPGFFTYLPGTLQVSPTADATVTADQNITVTFNTLTQSTPTVVITYAVTVDAAAEPSTPLTNTAAVAYTSLPGAAPFERTGSGGINDYFTSTQSSVRTGDLSIGKFQHEDRTYTIGEAITYTLLITLPTGITRLNPVITDFVPSGLRYDPSSSFISLTTSPFFVLPTYNMNYNPIGGGSGSVSSTVALAFTGDLINTTNQPATIAWTYRLLVADVATANHGEIKPNWASVAYRNAENVAQLQNTPPISITLVEPALVIEKSATPINAKPGETIFYQLRIYHVPTSTVPAYNVLIQDRLSRYLNYIDGTWELGNSPSNLAQTAIYTDAQPRLEALFPVIDSSYNISNPLTIGYQAVVKANTGYGTLINNVVTQTWTSLPNDPFGERRDGSGGVDDYHRSDQANVTVAAAAMEKTGPLTITAGTIITYQITVRNVSPLTATSALIQDTMPFQVETISATFAVPGANNGVCGILPAVSGDTVACNLAPMPPGVTATMVITGLVDPNTPLGADLTNVAEVTLIDASGTVLANTDEVETELDTRADLGIRKRGPLTVTAGSQVTYTLVFTNNGPSVSHASDVKDLLPAGVTYDNATTTQGLCVNAICQLGDVQPGTVVTMVVTGTVGSGITGVLTNTAQAFAATVDPDLSNNQSIVTSTSDALTRLLIDKIDLRDPVYAGSTYFYEVVVTNTGPSAASNVVITDRLPTQVTYQGASPECSHSSGVLTCTLGTLLPGESRDFLINTLVSSSVTSGTIGTNTVGVTTTTPLAAGSRISDSEQTTYLQPIGSPTDLAISKSVQPSTVVAGNGRITYTLVVSNNGPAPATAVQVVDAFPPQFDLLSASTSKPITQAACDIGVVCTIASMTAGERVTITLVFSVAANVPAALYTNTVAVSSPSIELTQTNNAATAPVTITNQANLTAVKVATPNPVVAGSNLHYQIIISNSGPSNASNVTLSDTLPSGFILSQVIASQGGCNALPCTLGTIPAGGNASVTIIGSVAPTATIASVRNAAQVTSTTPGSSATVIVSPTVSYSADLVLEKRATSTAGPGEPIQYTLTVVNLGPSMAQTVTLTDSLPVGVSASGFSNGCSLVGGSILCNSSVLSANASASYTISVIVSNSVAAGVSLENRAVVTSTASDSNPLNNRAEADTTIVANANLSISKSQVTANPITAGTLVTYTITITNEGPGSARDVDIKDLLPSGLSLVSASASDSGSLCSGTLCQFGMLPINATRTMTVVARVDSATAAGTLTNTAGVFSPDDGTALNNIVTATTRITTSALLSVTKSDLVDPVQAGGLLLYEITVHNLGPSDAQSVVVTDALPANTAFVGASAGCTASGASVICALGSMSAGSVQKIQVQVQVNDAASTGLMLTNLVTATSPTAALTATAIATTTVQQPTGGLVDLQLSKSAPVSVTAGNTLLYQLVITNAGPAVADSVQLVDALPVSATFVSAQIERSDGISPTGLCNTSGICNLGLLSVSRSVTVLMTVKVNADASGTITNSAHVASSNPDSNSANNSATASTAITTSSRLRISKSADRASMIAGNALQYQVTVVNDGPSVAKSVVVSDLLPTGFVLTAISSNPAGCSVLPCSISEIAVGGSASLTILGTVASSTSNTLTNSASVTSTTPLSSSSVTSASVGTVVETLADLSLLKQASANALPGATIVYTLTLFNAGPSDARTVRITDTLPTSVTFVSASSDCALSGVAVICISNVLTANHTATYTITVTVNGDVPPATSLENSAVVASTTTDLNPANNSATADTTILGAANLSISKSQLSINPIIAGSLVTYTITITNSGPGLARSVDVKDQLPAGLSLVSTVAQAGTCSGGVCQFGTLPVNATRTVTVVARIDAAAASGTYTNTASVFSTDESDATNNSATATTLVTTSATLSISKTALVNPVNAGEVIFYQITVRNSGPSDAQSVLISDTLPLSTTFAGADPLCSNSGQLVTCAIGTLVAGDERTLLIQARVSASAPAGLTVSNVATATSPTAATPVTDSEVVTIQQPSGGLVDLQVDKSGPLSATAGSTIQYRIVVSNSGPATAQSIQLADALPNGVTLLSVASSQGLCAGTVCQLADLGIGQSALVTITGLVAADVLSGTVLTNTVQVSSNNLDSNSANNTDSVLTTVNANALVSLDKSVTPSALDPGGLVFYRIVVTNSGPSMARSVVISDLLDGRLLNPLVNSSQGSCIGFPCALGDIQPGSAATIQIVATVANTATGTIINNATLSSATQLASGSGVNDSALVSVSALADLNVQKSGPATVNAGETIQYTLIVGNAGPSTAHSVRVTDALPSGVMFVGASSPCTVNSGVVLCATATLAANASVIYTITGRADASLEPGSSLQNIATVASATDDPSPLDNSDEALTNITTRVDLRLDKSGPVSVIAGEQVTYTIVVTNNGPSAAQSVDIKDTLPSQVELDDAAIVRSGVGPMACVASLCQTGDLASGEVVTITVAGTVDPAFTGTLTNSATVFTDSPISDTATTSDSVSTSVTASADLHMSKTDLTDPVSAGEVLLYQVVVTNSGPSVAQAVVISDVIPANTIFVGASPGCGFASGTVTCEVGALAADSARSFLVQVRVSDALASGSTIINSASVSSVTADPNASNNQITATTTVNQAIFGPADLAVSKSATPEPVVAGQAITYTILVSNRGPAIAQNVSMLDLLPSSLLVERINSSLGTCTSGGICALGTMAVGGLVTITVVGKVDSDQQTVISNTVSVAASNPDLNATNNLATVASTVNSQANLWIDKDTLFDPVTPGGQIFYRISVTNTGPSTAHNLTITDALPDNVTYQSAAVGCTESAGVISCPVASLAPNQRYDLLVTAFAPIDVVSGTQVVNRAVAAANNAATVSDAVTTTVRQSFAPPADIEVSKTGDLTVVAGREITYTIVLTNNGPAIATGVDLKEQLPAGVSATNITPSQGICLNGGLCQFGTIGVSQTVTVTVRGTVDPSVATGSLLTNTVRAFADNPDPNPNSNSASVTTTVTAQANLGIRKIGPATVTAGESIRYLIVVTNAGPSAAKNVFISDTLTATLVNVQVSDGCTVVSGVVTCTLATLAVGEQFIVTIDANVLSSAAGVINNSAVASSPSAAHPVTSTASTSVTTTADLALVKQATSTANAGESIQYTLTLRNFGPSDAETVVVTDTLPSGVSFVSASSGCSESSGIIVCSVGTMTAGQTTVITLSVLANSDLEPEASLENVATVTSLTADPNPLNNSDNADTSIVSAVDFVFDKSGPTSVIAGEQVTYTIVVTNNGPSSAQSVDVKDSLPSPIALDSMTVERSGSGVSACAGSLCQMGDMAAGEVVTITVVGTVDPSFTGILTNSATVFSDSPISNTATTSDSVIMAVSALVDLTLTKTDLNDPVGPGEGLVYQLSVLNAGPSLARNVMISDTLDPNVTFVNASSGCAESVGVVSCVVSSLNPSTAASFLVAVHVSDVASGTVIVNTAVVSSTTPVTNTTDDSTTITTTVQQSFGPTANLSISKSQLSASPIVAGERVTYSLVVTNAGPQAATHARVLDLIPTGTQIVSVTVSNPDDLGEFCSLAGSCYLGTILTNTTVLVSVLVKVDASFTDSSLTNSASIAADQRDPDASNNIDSVTSSVVTSADLSLRKRDLSDPVVAGEVLLYQITVSNHGTSDAQNVLISDTIPANSTFVGASSECTFAAGVLTCALATIKAGETKSVIVQVRVNIGLPVGVVITNTAALSSTTGDPNLLDNQETVTTTVQQSALNPTDLQVAKSASPELVVAGELLTYTVVVSNHGPAPATNVQMLDPLPNALELISISPTQGACNTIVNCDLGDLAVGGVVTVTIVAKVKSNQVAVVSNQARVSASNPDSNPANNQATVVSPVTALAALGIQKNAPLAAVPGGAIQYQIVISNAGPSDARNVVISDTLAASLHSAVASSSRGACTIIGQRVNCVLNVLPAGETAVIAINASINPNAAGTLTNTAQVSSPTDPTDSTATATTTIRPAADLQLFKDAMATVIAGETIRYTITLVNFGPSDAPNIVVTDQLPSGVTAVNLNSPCAINGGLVSCTQSLLAANSTATYTITVITDPNIEPGSTVINSASVTSGVADPNPFNNRDVAETSIVGSADVVVYKSGPATVIAGEHIRYTVVATNNGPSLAQSVDLVDTLPNSLSQVSVTTTQGLCFAGVCQFGDMAVGQRVTVSVSGIVASDMLSGSLIHNNVQVNATNADPNSNNNRDSVTTTVTTLSELTISKRAEPITATAGGLLSYLLDVSNGGPSAAQDVTLSDTLPVGFVPLQVSATCTVGQSDNRTVICALGSMGVSETVKVRIDGMVLSSVNIPLTNTATVTSTTPLTSTTNASTMIQSAVETKVDLVLQKDATPTTIAGTNAQYTITLRNNGPSDAHDLLVTDTLPISLTVVSVSNTCTVVSGEVVCNTPELAANVTAVFTITVLIDPKVEPGSSLQNVAFVTSSDIELDPTNNSDSADTNVTAQADLGIDKRGPATVVAGEHITYTLVVSNIGPSTAHFVDVKDALPPGITLDTSTVERTGSGSAACAGLVCEVGDMDVGEVVTITLAGKVDSGAMASAGELMNTATVFSNSADPNSANDSDTVNTVVTAFASLHIEKRDLADPVEPGGAVVYAIVITNRGPSDAENVVVSDLLPPGVVYQGSTGNCAEVGTGQLFCTIGTLKAGEVRTFLVVVMVEDTVVSGSTLRNTVLLSSSTPLSNSVLSDIEDTRVLQRFGPPADLAIEKKVSSAAVFADDLVTYTLVITNYGPATATDVEVIDALPTRVSFVRAVVPGGLCTSGVLCKLGALPFTDTPFSTTVMIVGRVASDVAQGSLLTNTALVSADQPDLNDANNIDEVPVTIDTVADLEIIKSSTSEATAAGKLIEYTLRVTNFGPATAVNVIVTDTLPPGVVFIEAAGCLYDGTITLTCRLDTLLRNELRTLPIVVQTLPDTVGELTNQAQVGSDTRESNLQNNTSSARNPVISTPDLAISKSVNRDRTFAGDVLTYTLTVVNQGPSLARNAQVIDVLPAGLTVLDATPAPLTLSSPLQWGIEQINVGEMRTFVYTVRTDGTLAPGTLLRNTAAVSVTGDPNLRNNGSQALAQVFGVADLEVKKSTDAKIVKRGENITYTIEVHNSGPSLAEDVDVKELLPPGMTIQQLQTTRGACTDSICQLGAVPMSNTVLITAVALVGPTTMLGAVLTNTAVVFSDTPDPNPSNNSDDASIIAGPVVNLRVSKAANRDIVNLLDEVTFSLVITNEGPSDAPVVIVTDTLPIGLSYVRSGIPCNNTGQIVTCTLGAMVAGAVHRFDMATIFNQEGISGTMTNQVVVAAPTSFETRLLDNQASAPISLYAIPTALHSVEMWVMREESRLTVHWSTSVEIGVVGYHVSRATVADPSQAVRITDGLIPATGAGITYSLTDPIPSGGSEFYYWVETQMANGSTALAGPIRSMGIELRLYLPVIIK